MVGAEDYAVCETRKTKLTLIERDIELNGARGSDLSNNMRRHLLQSQRGVNGFPVVLLNLC